MTQKIVVGSKETIDLPELGLFGITTRIDTGAQTSALHADHFVSDRENNVVEFEFHPDLHDVSRTIKSKVKLLQTKRVKSSNGEQEQRYIIQTKAVMGELEWTIKLSLTDRSRMNHLMLLGRQAMKGLMIVDPEHEFLASKAP